MDDPALGTGKVCAKPCGGACPSGYGCASVTGSGGDIVSMCVPKFGHLCEPCAASKDCASPGLKDAACVDQGPLGRFCAVLCTAAGDCPAGYTGSEVPTAEGGKLKQCVRQPEAAGQTYGVCGCLLSAVQKSLSTACYVEAKDAAGNVTGKCGGVRTCSSAGLSACTAPPASAEVCNGVDDDCDGLTDETGCDDKNACTQDICGGQQGCSHKPLDGLGCDADGSQCPTGDGCQQGVCIAGKDRLAAGQGAGEREHGRGVAGVCRQGDEGLPRM